MDDFDRAIFFSFDQSGAVDARLKAQAVAYCEQAKRSPTIWYACLEKFRVSQYAEVQFWCLQALEEVTRQRYGSLDPQERLFIRSSLMAAMCNYDLGERVEHSSDSLGARPVFVKNKLAQIIVILICIEYPSAWPSVFLDMLDYLSKGPSVVDMFCRIFNALDEEVISFGFSRTPEEIAAATRIKDAMRHQCISQIVGAWYSLVVMYRVQRPHLAIAVLDTMHRYVGWIDIGLVANDSFVPLLFEVLVSQIEVPQLRGAAADCLSSIVSKRMETTSKLALLQNLHIGQVCSRITEVQEPEFSLKLTTLLTRLATEILDCGKRIDMDNVSESTRASAEAVLTMLDEVLTSIFYFMRHGDEDVASSTFQFLSNYVARMKSGMSSHRKQATHIAEILEVIWNRMLCDPFRKDSLIGQEKDSQEEGGSLVYYRKDLVGLFRSILRVAPDITRTFVHSSLLSVLGNPDASFEKVEASISLLYFLGEGVTEDALKPGSGALGDIITTLLSTTVPCHSHRAVALMYLETVTRFICVVQLRPEYIPSVLTAFLDSRGLHHPNPSVRSRASYLFMRSVKVLRSQLTPYIEDILQSLQETLLVDDCRTVIMRADVDDLTYGFEAAGLLIGMEGLSEEKRLKFISALLVPLCLQVDSILTHEAGNDGDSMGPTSTVSSLQRVILAINHLSKGFGERLVTNGRASIGNVFKQTIDVIIRVLISFPKNKVLRSRVISFLHRMIDILGDSVFPSLSVAIRQLLTDSEPKDLVEVILLMNQVINKFKSGTSSILSEIFPAVLTRIFTVLPKDESSGLGMSMEEAREVQELHRSFFSFLHLVTSNDLSLVLITLESSPWLKDITQLLLEAACNDRDILVRKVCVQIFTKLISDWCGGSVEEKVPGFRCFVVERFASECCIFSVLQTDFDLGDANTFSLLGEIVTSQKVLYEKYGSEFLMHLATKLMPAVHCPPNLAEQYCLHIQRSDLKDLKAFYKPFIEKLKPCRMA